jgi:hypothetical protein
MAKIQPVVFPIIGTATDLIVRVLPFDMDAITATFYYSLNTEEGKMCTEGNLSMTPEEFAGWGSDNNYCNQWAASQLGLTLI